MDCDTVVNVEAYFLVKNLRSYLDMGTWWAFLWYLFQEMVVEIDESQKMVLLFKPLLPQPPWDMVSWKI